MAAEEVLLLLNLFDTFWFEQEILFTNNNTYKFSSHVHADKKLVQENPHEIQESSKLLCRSQSDYLYGLDSSKISSGEYHILRGSNTYGITLLESRNNVGGDSPLGKSPTSVLITHNKVAAETVKMKDNKQKKRRKRIIRIRRSSSELELEELKGFMDLGFKFSEEDKNSNLVTIVPGLQKWRNKAVDQEEKKVEKDSSKKRDIIVHKRPYLSEAWEILEKRKMSKKLLKWRFPAMNNDMNMKDNLRFWAQTVASTFR